MSREELRSFIGSTKTSLRYKKCKFIAEVPPCCQCCQYVLSGKMLKNFYNFSIMHEPLMLILRLLVETGYIYFFSTKWQLFTCRNSEFFLFQLEWTTSHDVGRYKDICFAQMTSEFLTHRSSSQSMTIFLRESGWIHKSVQLVSTYRH